MSESSSLKITNGIKSLIDQLPNISYGNYVIPNLNIEEYGSGQEAYDLLKKNLMI